MPGQLDEISEAIGELKGSVKAIERYIHEDRHGVKDLSQKVDGLGALFTREIAKLEARIQVRIEAMDERLAALERKEQRREGAVGALSWLAKNWPFSAIAAALAAWIAWANGKLS